ncbi:MAG: hypothetical protein COB23_00670 [Methylophaga sp.]|nr:MAG: hypothetical protein COB23_00670 [Methylophaga sp.]
MQEIDRANFIARYQLPESYAQYIQDWFMPVAEQIMLQQREMGQALVVGINGAQGAGKSTLAALLVAIFKQQYQLNSVSISIDDFYLTRYERKRLAANVHSLMATRGVPGTHDVVLLKQVLTHLINKMNPVDIPRFNKAIDDRCPADKWDCVTEPIDIIVVEGWCLGAEPQGEQALLNPVNQLEADEDRDAGWRHYVNQQLQDVYPALFDYIDRWIMLKAPSFDCVFNWRLEQENKLEQLTSEAPQLMDESAIKRFIQHYQRITENTLETLPGKVDYLFELNEQREITKLVCR